MTDVQATIAALEATAATIKRLEAINRELRRDLDGTCVTLHQTERGLHAVTKERDMYRTAYDLLVESLIRFQPEE